MSTGAATLVGAPGNGDLDGLSFAADGTLYAVSDGPEQLYTVNPSDGSLTALPNPLGADVDDPGLTFGADGRLWLSDSSNDLLFEVDPATGIATQIGPLGQEVVGLAGACDGTIYGLGGGGTDNLVTIDTTTGAATSVGPLLNVAVDEGGIDFDANDVLWGIRDDNPAQTFSIDPSTGTATVVANVTGGSGDQNFRSLALSPLSCGEPPPPPPPSPPVPVAGTPRFTG